MGFQPWTGIGLQPLSASRRRSAVVSALGSSTIIAQAPLKGLAPGLPDQYLGGALVTFCTPCPGLQSCGGASHFTSVGGCRESGLSPLIAGRRTWSALTP